VKLANLLFFLFYARFLLASVDQQKRRALIKPHTHRERHFHADRHEFGERPQNHTRGTRKMQETRGETVPLLFVIAFDTPWFQTTHPHTHTHTHTHQCRYICSCTTAGTRGGHVNMAWFTYSTFLLLLLLLFSFSWVVARVAPPWCDTSFCACVL